MSNGNQFGMTAEELEASMAEEGKLRPGEAFLESVPMSVEGAKIGSAGGPWGTAIGASVGGTLGLVGALKDQRLSASEEAANERLLGLLRQAEAGELGLTDAEQQEIFGRLSAPALIDQRAAQQRALQAAASQDVGAGAFFRGAQQEETARAQTMAITQQELLRQDLAKRAQQKELIERLLEQRAARLDEDAFDFANIAKASAEEAAGFAAISGALFEESEAELGDTFGSVEQAAEAGTATKNLYGNATQSGGAGMLYFDAMGN